MFRTSLTKLGWLPFMVGGLSIAQGGAYSVKPVRIELSTRQPFTTVYVMNRSIEPATVQAHIVEWSADGTEERLTDNDDILLNPPIFTVQPGREQSMRLGLRRPRPEGAEATYRLILEEVPPPPKPGFMGVTTLLKISVPIFVKPKLASPQLVWTAQRLPGQEVRLSVENRGNAHVQIKKLAVKSDARQEPDFEKNMNAYVLRNGRKEWVIRDERLLEADRLSLDALTDSGEIREEVAPHSP